jgi:hypothetical protein
MMFELFFTGTSDSPSEGIELKNFLTHPHFVRIPCPFGNLMPRSKQFKHLVIQSSDGTCKQHK